MTISSAVAPTEGDAPAGTRSEHDLLGYLDVPADAYYGVHTARAADNFPITGIRLEIYPIFISALAAVKQAAALANRDIGASSRPRRTRSSLPRTRFAPGGCTTSSSST